MPTTTTCAAAPVPPVKRCSPGGWTKQRERERQRDAFARNLLALVRELHEAGVDTNAAIAEALNARGIATEHGGPWKVQTVAGGRYRLLVLGASPPPARIPPQPPRCRKRRT